MCGVIVINDRSIPVPPSNIGKHLAALLDSTDGTDVSFIVDSETFYAPRTVLAARSPVFKAELLGSMSEAAMSSITLHDIAPATFRVMLRFMYTDVFPGDDELGESPTEMMQRLLAAADRYALDRLKLMCAQKLWSDVSVDTAASTLAFAEMHNCLELKKNCIDFFAEEKNFRNAVLTQASSRVTSHKTKVQVGATMSGSTLAEFKVDYKRNKDLPIGEAVCSDPFSGSGLTWRMHFYPRGLKPEHNGEYVSFFLELLSKSSSVKATVEASLEGNGAFRKKTSTHRFCKEEDKTGWCQFVSLIDLQNNYLRQGHIKFLCDVMVLSDNPILVPPSDIVKHLGILLDSMVGADVSFNVNGETFHAHWAILASRSPVFKAELLGSMAEATMSRITIHDIPPETFRVMLRYMYTDTLPRDDELGDSLYENLLAAAERYALDRLKVMCAQKLWDNVSVDTVATTLACAEIYDCPLLRKKCMDFFLEEKNFRKAVLTPGFIQLGQQCPSIIDELRERIETCL
ncbi:hypothetical protein PR202_ga21552 [Eleusine coracana subsp. coracana]|uniref:Uncharacterized protein n=1 Tax=Eleusine coracana subsp. coracana TaxID=191504 RepID=A0AAV5D1Q3_ELECO|nr:hypothetical protein PR202_ga21552 [Eleusine coracana subsp. coracana]